jgi:ABC-type uncharacterized transport system auxiliary subunit
MKILGRIVPRIMVTVGLTTLMAGCVTLNRLDEFQLEDRTAAAIILRPPRAEVFTNFSFWIDPNDPVGSALRVGSGLIREAEAKKAQERMDKALERVDLVEIIRVRTLEGGAEIIRCQTVDRTDQADLLFDIEIREYGIDARSGGAGLDFRINVQVELLDTRERATVWRRRIRESTPISPYVFGLDDAVGTVLTAVALSQLTEEQMAKGFERLAEDAATHIVSKLHKDFLKVRYR